MSTAGRVTATSAAINIKQQVPPNSRDVVYFEHGHGRPSPPSPSTTATTTTTTGGEWTGTRRRDTLSNGAMSSTTNGHGHDSIATSMHPGGAW